MLMARDEGIMTSNIMITVVDGRFRSHYIILCRSTKRKITCTPVKINLMSFTIAFRSKENHLKVGVGVVRERFACGCYGYNSLACWDCLRRLRIRIQLAQFLEPTGSLLEIERVIRLMYLKRYFL